MCSSANFKMGPQCLLSPGGFCVGGGPGMEYSCLLCPLFMAKSAGEKKRHKESHKKAQTVRSSDGASVKTAVEGHKVDCEGFVGAEDQSLAADGDNGAGTGGLGAAGGGLGLSDQVSSHAIFI